MLNFDDYKKNFEEMFSKSPISLEDFYKSVNDYNSKFSKIAFWMALRRFTSLAFSG